MGMENGCAEISNLSLEDMIILTMILLLHLNPITSRSLETYKFPRGISSLLPCTILGDGKYFDF
jgi:hypothetical protein